MSIPGEFGGKCILKRFNEPGACCGWGDAVPGSLAAAAPAADGG